MGRTNPTVSDLVSEWEQSLARYRRVLRRPDQLLFDELLVYVKTHAAAAGHAANALPENIFMISIVLEQQRQINALQESVNLLTARLEAINE